MKSKKEPPPPQETRGSVLNLNDPNRVVLSILFESDVLFSLSVVVGVALFSSSPLPRPTMMMMTGTVESVLQGAPHHHRDRFQGRARAELRPGNLVRHQLHRHRRVGVEAEAGARRGLDVEQGGGGAHGQGHQRRRWRREKRGGILYMCQCRVFCVFIAA